MSETPENNAQERTIPGPNDDAKDKKEQEHCGCYPEGRLSIEGMSSKATRMLQHLTQDGLPTDKLASYNDKIKDHKIPRAILKHAKGIAFITMLQTGVFFGARGGTGILIARKEDGSWTDPAPYGVGGLAFGCVFGASAVDVLLILNTAAQVKAFKGKGQVQLGVDVNATAGPFGRDAQASVAAGDKGVTAAYSYNFSQGLYIGASVDPGILMARKDETEKFYGEGVTNEALLEGKAGKPDNEIIKKLHDVLAQLLKECNEPTPREEDGKDEQKKEDKKE